MGLGFELRLRLGSGEIKMNLKQLSKIIYFTTGAKDERGSPQLSLHMPTLSLDNLLRIMPKSTSMTLCF